MSDTSQMVSAPRELLEQALDAAAAVGMQDVADELDRILTPKAELYQAQPVAYAVFTDSGNIRIWSRNQDDVGLKICEEENKKAIALYDHVDPRDAGRLHAEIRSLRQHKTEYMEAAEETRKALLAQFDERDERFNHKTNPSPPLTDLLTPEQAAQLLGLSVKTLATWRSTGRHALPFTRCGARIRYQRTEIIAWLAGRAGARP